MSAPHIPGWQSIDSVQRAQAAIDWCQANGVDTSSINARGLAGAMNALAGVVLDEGIRDGDADFSPVDYVHQIRAIAAYLAAR